MNSSTTQLKTPCYQDTKALTMYLFRSQPKPLLDRPAYRSNVKRPRGIHDYYNVMWDPRVRRGTYQSVTQNCLPQKRTQPNKIRKSGSKFSNLINIHSGKKRRSLINLQATETNLKIGDGRVTTSSQTEPIVETLEADMKEHSAETQTDAIHESHVLKTGFSQYRRVAVGDEKGTQLEMNELFDIRKLIQPVVENVTVAIAEQALLEVMEEEEMFSLRQQQAEFDEIRRKEQARLMRLEQREQDAQKERAALIKKQMANAKEEQDVENILCVSNYSASLLGDLLGTTLNILRDDGFLKDEFKIAMEADFLPWLNSTVDDSVNRYFVGRLLLDDIIEGVVTKREARTAVSKWLFEDAPPVVVKPIKWIESNMSSVSVGSKKSIARMKTIKSLYSVGPDKSKTKIRASKMPPFKADPKIREITKNPETTNTYV